MRQMTSLQLRLLLRGLSLSDGKYHSNPCQAITTIADTTAKSLSGRCLGGRGGGGGGGSKFGTFLLLGALWGVE